MAGERYNNGLATKIFYDELDKNVDWLEYLGASKTIIAEYKKDAKNWFYNERKYYEKTISYNQNVDGWEDEGYSPLLTFGFEDLVTYIEIQEKGYLSWIYSLDNAERIKIIKGLSFKQQVFLTEVAQNGKTFVEVAKITGYSRQTVSVNITKIYNMLRPLYENEYAKGERRFKARAKYKTQRSQIRKRIYDEELQCEREMLNVEIRNEKRTN